MLSFFAILIVASFMITAKIQYTQFCKAEIKDLNLPPGFRVEVFADVKEPRQMAFSPNSGYVYTGSKEYGLVHVVATYQVKSF